MHDTNPPAQSVSKLQQNIYMLTLTKGEKLQSLLQNAMRANHEELIGVTKSASGTATCQATQTAHDNANSVANKTNQLPLVKLFQQLDNNNIPEEHLSPPLSPDATTICTTAAVGAIGPTNVPTTIKEEPIEVNIVEQTDEPKHQQQPPQLTNADTETESISENVIDSARTSVSTMSLESDKCSSDVDTSPQQSIDNNNSFADNNEVIVSPTEEQIGTTTTTENGTKIIDGIEEATEVTIDAQLDINENKTTEPDAGVIENTIEKTSSVDNVTDNTACDNVKDNTVNDDIKCQEGTENAECINGGTTKTTATAPTSATVPQNDLDDKVQNVENKTTSRDEVKLKSLEMPASKPIEMNTSQNDDNDDDDNLSPLLKARQPLNSPRLIKTKDIMSELPLTPDSSHSLDSSCEYSTSFEMKPYSPAHIPERSFSSESLNSETSIDSNDSKSSIKLAEAKFNKNGTLERQTTNGITVPTPPTTTPTGLQVLMLWNNRITRNSSQSMSDLLSATTTLEILNVGKNVLSNEFITNIKSSLKTNTSLTSLGLQSSHLSSDGVKTLSELLDFGANVTLQRIDLRDNNLQVSGLTALNEVMKSNKSVTRIDLDDVARRYHVSFLNSI